MNAVCLLLFPSADPNSKLGRNNSKSNTTHTTTTISRTTNISPSPGSIRELNVGSWPSVGHLRLHHGASHTPKYPIHIPLSDPRETRHDVRVGRRSESNSDAWRGGIESRLTACAHASGASLHGRSTLPRLGRWASARHSPTRDTFVEYWSYQSFWACALFGVGVVMGLRVAFQHEREINY